MTIDVCTDTCKKAKESVENLWNSFVMESAKEKGEILLDLLLKHHAMMTSHAHCTYIFAILSCKLVNESPAGFRK